MSWSRCREWCSLLAYPNSDWPVYSPIDLLLGSPVSRSPVYASPGWRNLHLGRTALTGDVPLRHARKYRIMEVLGAKEQCRPGPVCHSKSHHRCVKETIIGLTSSIPSCCKHAKDPFRSGEPRQLGSCATFHPSVCHSAHTQEHIGS